MLTRHWLAHHLAMLLTLAMRLHQVECRLGHHRVILHGRSWLVGSTCRGRPLRVNRRPARGHGRRSSMACCDCGSVVRLRVGSAGASCTLSSARVVDEPAGHRLHLHWLMLEESIRVGGLRATIRLHMLDWCWALLQILGVGTCHSEIGRQNFLNLVRLPWDLGRLRHQTGAGLWIRQCSRLIIARQVILGRVSLCRTLPAMR